MDLDIRYVAGLFDGEGWITVCKQKLGERGYGHYSPHHVRYQLVVGIGIPHRPIIEQMHRQFGGGLFTNRSAQVKMPKSRPGYMWKVSSGPASSFLDLLLPHLVVKRDEAVIALQFHKHVRAHITDFRYHPEMREGLYAEREEFRRQLLVLKKRTYESPVDDDPVSAAA